MIINKKIPKKSGCSSGFFNRFGFSPKHKNTQNTLRVSAPGLLDYVQKYVFVNRLGSLASQSGYNIRIFNYEKESLATYICNFPQSPSSCRLQMNSQSKVSFSCS